VDRLEYFARLAAESPEVARVRFAHANELLHAGRLEEAVAELRAYLDLAEDEGNAWGRLGEALATLGRPEEAADAYLTGIEQALAHGHTGMAEDFEAAVQRL
jgi:predicted Zn-dependent protease